MVLATRSCPAGAGLGWKLGKCRPNLGFCHASLS